MYTVKADDRFLYHPRMVNNGYAIYNPVLTLEANKAGSFQFTLPVTNVLYNSLVKMKTIITVYKDNEEIFRGRILNDERDFNNNKSVYCEGELAFLLDSIIRPYDFKNKTIREFFTYVVAEHNTQVDDEKKFVVGDVSVLADTQITVNTTEYLSAWNVINTYLLDVYGGYIRVRLSGGIRYLDYISSYGNTNTQTVAFGENMLDITQYISADQLFTHLIPLGATYTIDLDTSEITTGQISKLYTEPIANKGGTSSNFIFSLEVILNSQDHSDANNKKSNITIKYGVKTKDGRQVSWSGLSGDKIYADITFDPGISGQSTVKQKSGKASLTVDGTEQTLVTWTGNVATGSIVITGEFINQYTTSTNAAKPAPISNSMASVVQLLQQKYIRTSIATVNNNKDYLVDSTAESMFGKIVAVHTWDDVTDPAELKTLGEQYLADNVKMAVKLEVNAVDLNLMNVNYEKFKIGDRVRVVSAPHVLDDYFTLSKMTLYLQQPENNTYNLGAEFKTLTETQVTAAKDISVTNEIISQLNNDLDAVQTLTEQLNELINQIYDQYADVKTVINNLDTAYADIDFANIGAAAIANLVANNALITELHARYAEIDLANITDATIANLMAKNATIDALKANFAQINMANVTDATIQNLLARQAVIEYLKTQHLDAAYADINFAHITDAAINNLVAKNAFADYLVTNYAQADFANIGDAAITKIFGATGIINNLTISEGYVTGSLNGVTINGDLIVANTLKADRLLVRGTDGLYYQLNARKHQEGEITDAQWEQLTDAQLSQSLHGTNIIANSITANQIAAGTITANELSTALATQIDDNTTGLTTLSTSVNGISASVQTLQTTSNTHTSQISALQASDQSINASVSEISNRDTLASYVVSYGYSTSPTTQPADSAFTYSEMPARQEGQYIWRKATTRYYRNGELQDPTTSYEMVQGADGDPGRGISSVNYYYKTTSTQSTPSASSVTSTTIPAMDATDNKYLWQKEVINYTTGNPTTTVSLIAVYGDQATAYDLIASAYAVTRNVNNNNAVSPSSITFSAYSQTGTSARAAYSGRFKIYTTTNGTSWTLAYDPSSNQSSYTYTVPTGTTITGIKCELYLAGGTSTLLDSQTIPYINTGTNGTNGTSVTVSSVKYASSTSNTTAPSSGWQDTTPSVAEGSYLWTKTTFSDGNVAYSVAKQGKSGTNGTSVTITDKEVVYQASSSGTTVPTGTWVANPPTISNGQYLWTRTTVTYSDGNSTIAYSIGYKGTNGIDAYTVVLTNESHIFPADATKAIAGNTTCNVIGYKGATQMACTIGTITGQVTGLTTSITSNGTTNAYFTVTVTTSLTTRNGVLTVPVTIDGKTFNKEFSWSLAIAGEDAIQIASVDPIYYEKKATLDMVLKGATEQDGTPTPDAPVDVRTVSGNNEIITIGKNICPPGVNTYSAYASHTSTGGQYEIAEPQVLSSGVRINVIAKCGGSNPWAYVNPTGVTSLRKVLVANPSTQFTISFDLYTSSSATMSVRVQNGDGSSASRLITFGTNISGTPNQVTKITATATTSATNGESSQILNFDIRNFETGSFIEIGNIQIEKGATATPFESYISKSYPINLPVKNLIWYMNNRLDDGITFDYDSESGGVHVSGTATANAYEDIAITDVDLTNYPHVPAGTYTASINSGEGASDSNIRINVKYMYDDGTNGDLVANVAKSKTFTMAQSGYIYVRMMVVSGGTVDEIVYPQIEKGSKVNAFQVYGAQQIELRKIGEYQDYIYQNEDKWYVKKLTDSYTYSGSNSWSKSSRTETNSYYWSNGTKLNTINRNTIPDTGSTQAKAILAQIYCDKFTAGAYESDVIPDIFDPDGGVITVNWNNTNNYSQSRINVGIDSPYTDEGLFKVYMNTLRPTIYFALDEPQDVEITYEPLIDQLNNLAQATSFASDTRIIQVNNDLPFDISYDTTALEPPELPTEVVTEHTSEVEKWSLDLPTPVQGYRYWNSMQTVFEDNSVQWTDPTANNIMTELETMRNEYMNLVTQASTKYNSDLLITKEQINSWVERVENIEGAYIDEDGLVNELKKHNVVYRSDIEQTEGYVQRTFTRIATTYTDDALKDYKDEVSGYIRETADGVEIGKSNISYTMELHADGLELKDQMGQLDSWFGAGEKGLGTSQLSVGSANNPGQRWKMVTRKGSHTDGSHLTFIRHN